MHLSVCWLRSGSNKLVKKDLFNIDLDNSSKENGLRSQKACEPCNLEGKKINRKINGRKIMST
jgi:hypothetical protein